MTVDQLEWAVGTMAAARLVALKSKLADTPEERAAEELPSSVLIDMLRAMRASRKEN